MQYARRVARLQIGSYFMVAILLGALAYRMVWHRDDIRYRDYVDQATLDLFYRLADEGAIVDAGGDAAVDEVALEKALPGEKLRQYVRRRISYMSFVDGKLEVDTAAVRVTNRRLLAEAITLQRGSILDRNGNVLAGTRKSTGGVVVRDYPLGPAAMPLVGVAHAVYGLKGLERNLSPLLEGKSSEGLFRQFYRFLAGKTSYHDAVLTIDADLQKTAYTLLGDRTGAVVVLDITNGDILAAASTPAFDPATPSGRQWDEAAELRHRGPLISRAFQRRYPPGSTFKLVTAAAWMAREDYDPAWGIDCKGRHSKYGIREYHGRAHGWTDLKNAVKLSCNVFFAEAGAQLGPRLLDQAERFGFNRLWPLTPERSDETLSIPSVAFSGRVIGSAHGWRDEDFRRNPKLLAQAGVGQNIIEATPLQMALVAAAIGNGGRLMAPRLLKEVHYVDEDGKPADSWIKYRVIDPEVAGRACSEETAAALLAMMGLVVDKGTGFKLKKLYREEGAYHLGRFLPEGGENLLAGKTGTAEAGAGQGDHSWFVAVAPRDKPKIAVAVLVEHGGLGVAVAGPIAAEIMAVTLNTKSNAS